MSVSSVNLNNLYSTANTTLSENSSEETLEELIDKLEQKNDELAKLQENSVSDDEVKEKIKELQEEIKKIQAKLDQEDGDKEKKFLEQMKQEYDKIAEAMKTHSSQYTSTGDGDAVTVTNTTINFTV